MGCGGSKPAEQPAKVPITAEPVEDQVAPVAPPAGKPCGGQDKKQPPRKKALKFQVKLAGTWQDYDKEEDAVLKKAYLVGQPNAKYRYREQVYEYNFVKMTQKNLESNKIREIRPPPSMKQPPAPLLPKGPMVVITVKKGQAGQCIEIDDPNNKGKKLSVNVPSGAKPGQKMAVPVPEKGEAVEQVQQRQKGHSTGAKLAMGTAVVAAVGGLAVGGVILGDHLSDGAVGDAVGVDIAGHTAAAGEAIGDAAGDAAEWAEGAGADAAEWAEGAGADAADWAEGAVDDAVDWIEGAGEDAGDFIMSLF